tara:strand:- start:458 stop:685 length:228 start_codon:yes stop_codon:yes gene_type:complete
MSNIYYYLDIYSENDDDASIDLNSQYSEESEESEESGESKESEEFEESEDSEKDDGAGVLTPRSRKRLINQLVLS